MPDYLYAFTIKQACKFDFKWNWQICNNGNIIIKYNVSLLLRRVGQSFSNNVSVTSFYIVFKSKIMKQSARYLKKCFLFLVFAKNVSLSNTIGYVRPISTSGVIQDNYMMLLAVNPSCHMTQCIKNHPPTISNTALGKEADVMSLTKCLQSIRPNCFWINPT